MRHAELSIVFIGEIYSGKSETAARLVHNCSDKTKGTEFKYALNEHGENFNRVGRSYSYQDYRGLVFPNHMIKSVLGDLRIYDTSEDQTHRKLLISAVNISDFAVLIVSVEDPCIEINRMLARLALASGMNQLIVGINKMDMVQYSN